MQYLPAVIVIGLAGCATATHEVDAPMARASTDNLIELLLAIDGPVPGIDPATASRGFPPDGAPATLLGVLLAVQGPDGVMRPPDRPVDSSIATEIVARGAGAVPELLACLDDDRTTRYTVEPGRFNFAFDTSYEPRAPQPPPTGIGLVDLESGFSSGATFTFEGRRYEPLTPINGPYTVRLGDVCLTLLGQIVGREYSAVRYQPSGNMYVRSPVETPVLAQKARLEWSRLTDQTFEAQLRSDLAQDVDAELHHGALRRLKYYFPATYTGLTGADAEKRAEFEVWLASETRGE